MKRLDSDFSAVEASLEFSMETCRIVRENYALFEYMSFAF